MPMVVPSGAALATTSVPRLPLAPGRLSITNVCFGLRLQPLADQPHDDVGRRSRRRTVRRSAPASSGHSCAAAGKTPARTASNRDSRDFIGRPPRSMHMLFAGQFMRRSSPRMTGKVPSASVAAPWMPPVPCLRPALRPIRPRRRGPRHARSWSSISRSRPPIRTACCSTGWATSTSCSSTTPRSPRARSASCSPSAASISAATSRCAACRSIRADEYLHRLIALGHRVAVCEQIEDPAQARKRGSKSVVRRDVVRLVTPGTLTEDTLLDARPQQLPARASPARARRPRTRRAASRSPGSTFRPASSASPNATAPASPPSWRGSSRARSSSPTRSIPMPSSRRSCARCRR